MPDLLTIERHRDEIIRLAQKHGAYDLRVFGSIARGESGTTSDIDLLVRFEEGRSLLDLIAFKFDLEEMLGFSVDVVTDESLHWTIRDHVLEEARAL